jgi:tRNA pseudouridine38-40 synthase
VDDGELQIEFVGKGFLRHQVRIMVGTLVDLGLGRIEEADLIRIREARDRAAAGKTAPARGLALVDVEIGDGPLFSPADLE